MGTITLNGVEFDSDDFTGADGYGYLEEVTLPTGETLPRFQALFAAAIADLGTARIATSASSRSTGLSGSQTWVLASDVPFAVGAWVIIARTSAPTTTFFIAQVTGYVSATKTLTVTIFSSDGSGGPYTDWTVSLVGRPISNCAYNIASNGSFDIWQNGTSFTENGGYQYCADRWKFAQSSGSANFTASQQTGTNSRYALRLQRTAAAVTTANCFLSHTIESVDSIPQRGQYLTLSFSVKAGANLSSSMTAQIYSGTGTDEATPRNFTGAASIASLTITSGELSTSAYTRFTVTTSAVVADSVNQLGIVFTKANTGTAGADDWIQIENVQLERGLQASAFRPTDIAETERRCLRHFRKSFALATAPAQNAGTTGAIGAISHVASAVFGAQVHFDRMRAAPTVTTYNPSASNANWRDTTNAADRTASVGTASDSGFLITGAAGAAAATNLIHYRADARI